MQVIRSLSQMMQLVYPAGKSVGFVPTMGYLHRGHLSLIQASKRECDITVASIFVNPAQFAPKEDLSTYPRDIERDLKELEKLGTDYVFIPSEGMIYPEGFGTWVEVKRLSEILCGNSRPGHFKGVCTIVLKLINIVRPDIMFMGEKDYQQLMILRKMLEDLNLRTKIMACPIVREADGLAMSSRNSYLGTADRALALSLYKALVQTKKAVAAGKMDTHMLIALAKQTIRIAGANVDYVEILDSRDLSEQESINEHSRMLIAAYVGKTRLIDNISLNSED